METIKNYLENMFAAFAQTQEILNLKRDLAIGMEDKYNELKSSGKSEHEAIGIVISEFGSIEELVEELNIPQSSNSQVLASARILTRAEVTSFLSDKQKYGRLNAIGVFLCILGASTFLFLSNFLSGDYIISNPIFSNMFAQNSDALSSLSFIPLCLFVGIAVALFICTGIHLEKYKYLEQPFMLDSILKNEINVQRENYRSKQAVGISFGVVSCIFAFLIFIIMSTTITQEPFQILSLCVALLIIAVATLVFITIGASSDAFNQLLKENEFSEAQMASNKTISVVASIVWPLTTAGYLVWSLLTNDWHITWIVWPIVGILFGSFSAIASILTKKDLTR